MPRVLWGWMLIGLIFHVLVGPMTVMAEEGNGPGSWSRQAENIDRLVDEGKWEQAKGELNRLADNFSKGDFSQEDLQVEGIESLSDTLVELDRELVRVMPRPDRLQFASERMRLAFDALAHPHQPLWHQYEPQLLEDIARVRQAMKKNQPETVRSRIRIMVRHYEQLEPALFVSRKPEVVGAVGSILHSMEQTVKREPMQMSRLRTPLDQWEQMIPPLIKGKDQNVLAVAHTGRPAWPMSAVILGGIIASALLYVGWQKYRHTPEGVMSGHR
ncbi:MAG: sporulation protein YpjB [Firmicutes bacterium]|nr:sporulation protein YpjB [Bacillota bacterium]